MLSVTGQSSIAGLTAGDGPWLFGVMQGDLSLAELEVYLEQNGPITPADIALSEVASRGKYIRKLGSLIAVGDGTVAVAFLDHKSLSGLKAPETAETLGSGGWAWWLYNVGTQMTTGATWKVIVDHFVRFNPSG